MAWTCYIFLILPHFQLPRYRITDVDINQYLFSNWWSDDNHQWMVHPIHWLTRINSIKSTFRKYWFEYLINYALDKTSNNLPWDDYLKTSKPDTKIHKNQQIMTLWWQSVDCIYTSWKPKKLSQREHQGTQTCRVASSTCGRSMDHPHYVHSIHGSFPHCPSRKGYNIMIERIHI